VSSLNTLRRLLGGSLLLLTLSQPADKLVAQTAPDEPTLEPGKPVERELDGGQDHAYRLKLAAGQYVHVVVMQRGIDVVVRLSGPDGRRLAEVDGLNGTQGPEPIFYVAAHAGIYYLEVRPLNKPADAGRYEVRIEELRTAKGTEGRRIKAETLLDEAALLRREGTAESLNRALGKYAEALPLFHSLGDTLREVLTLNLTGTSYSSLGDRPKAFSSFTRALTLARAAVDRSGEGVALNSLGGLYLPGEPRKGLESSSQALQIFQDTGDSANEAVALINIGTASLRLGDVRRARESYSRALSLARAVGERGSEARSLGGLGYVERLSGEAQKAMGSFNEALTVARVVSDRGSEADALAGLGVLSNDSGEAQKALSYLSQALPLFHSVGDRAGEAATFYNLGLAHSRLIDKEKAFESFTQAFRLAREVNDRSIESRALVGIGLINISVGESQKALDHLTQALSIARETGDQHTQGEALSTLGYTYGRVGETQKAIDSFNQAFPLLRATGNRAGEALALVWVGFVHLNALDIIRAQDSFTRARALAQAIGDRNIEAQALNGLSLFSLDKPQKALDYLTQSLTLSGGTNNRGGEADSLNAIGFTYFFSGEPQKALDSFGKALNLYRALHDRHGETTALANLALVERAQNNLVEARAHIEAAIKIFESLRTKIVNQAGRTSYFASAQEYYRFYIDLLMRLHAEYPSGGHDGEALQASELSRARALLDTLAEAKADIRKGVNPRLVQRERSLQQQLNDKAQAQMRLLRGPHTKDQADALAKEIEELTNAYEQVRTDIRQTSPSYAALTQPKPLTLKEIQALMSDEDTLLLEYSLGSINSYLWADDEDEHSYLWAVTSDSIKSYELAGRSEIEAAARRVYDLLNARSKRIDGETPAQRRTRISQSDAELPNAAAALSRLVLAPVAAELGKKRLVIVADGILQYIPFPMLHDPNAPAGSAAPQPLIIEHEIVSLPSASTLSVIRREVDGRKPAPKTVIALADPVFTKDDERVKGVLHGRNSRVQAPTRAKAEAPRDLELIEAAEDTGFGGGELRIPRLPDSRRETKEIVAMVPAAERKLILDFGASRAAATSAELGQYRYVHFSTHGFLNSVHPELSGVVFSLVNRRGEAQDGFLRAHEVFNLRLPAEVVVLSACQTGIGKEVQGEGLISLTRGFMYAGAPRVVVSLWSVNEVGTSELMVRFYQQMLKKGLRPAAALRAAQVSLMKETKWQSPFYWAAFTLQGEWR
jgi:CHAT domain-containing protein/tetratricopeptide (TPR) repeat protein